MEKISLQGSMAVGKTTVAKLLEPELSTQFKVLFEPIKRRPDGLNPNIEQEYYDIQKYFISLEIERYDKYLNMNTLFDLGPEEIVFYTINYPKSCGYDWDVQANLKAELAQLRNCRIDTVLYLDAEVDEITRRKENDKNRNRSFFYTYIHKLNPLKKEWMLQNYNTRVIDITNTSQEEVKILLMRILKGIKIN